MLTISQCQFFTSTIDIVEPNLISYQAERILFKGDIAFGVVLFNVQ